MTNDEEIGPEEPARVEPEANDEKERMESGSGQGEEKKGGLRGFLGAFPHYAVRRPVLFFLAALFLGAAGAWGFLNGASWKGDGAFKPSYPREAVAEDGLRQQELGRFYIPMRDDGPYRVMVVDWSVVWDGLSAVRFSKSEVAIRNRIYDSLIALTAREEEVHDNISSLEETISRALKDGLRNESVSVRIKEVKTY